VSKKLVYGESYAVQPTDKRDVIKDLAERKSEVSRSQKLGVLLREEKTRSQELQRRVNRLDEENRRLRETLAKRSR
jgi:cell shape-determining protein MreC